MSVILAVHVWDWIVTGLLEQTAQRRVLAIGRNVCWPVSWPGIMQEPQSLRPQKTHCYSSDELDKLASGNGKSRRNSHDTKRQTNSFFPSFSTNTQSRDLWIPDLHIQFLSPDLSQTPTPRQNQIYHSHVHQLWCCRRRIQRRDEPGASLSTESEPPSCYIRR